MTGNHQKTDELPILVAGKIFQTITLWLTKALERARMVIFELLGFLFTHWSALSVLNNQLVTQFIWEKETANITFDYDSVGIAETEKFDKASDESSRRSNLILWRTMLEQNRNLVLLSSYELVFQKERERKHEEYKEDHKAGAKEENSSISGDGKVKQRRNDCLEHSICWT